MSISLDNIKELVHNNKVVKQITDSQGNVIWKEPSSGGTSIYCSYGNHQFEYVNGDWVAKQWLGDGTGQYDDFNGENIWTDGTNIYRSEGNGLDYVLDVATSTWSTKTWTGIDSSALSYFKGENIWTDGIDIYFSYNLYQYKLNKSTGVWSTVTWKNTSNQKITNLIGKYIWTDGVITYCSNGKSVRYVFIASRGTWSTVTWNNFSQIYGDNIWFNGTNFFFTDQDSYKYKYNSLASCDWDLTTFNGCSSFSGKNVFSDGTDYYLRNLTSFYKLDSSTNTWNTITSWSITWQDIYGDKCWNLDWSAKPHKTFRRFFNH